MQNQPDLLSFVQAHFYKMIAAAQRSKLLLPSGKRAVVDSAGFILQLLNPILCGGSNLRVLGVGAKRNAPFDTGLDAIKIVR